MNTEILLIHGFTTVDETNASGSDEWIRDVNSVLPGTMFAVYDASMDNPGYYVVEHKEISSYTEA